MQRMHPSLAMCLFAMIAPASHSHAAYTGVTLQLHTTIQAPTGTKKVFRLYANFSQGSDEVVSWGGTPQNGSTIFKTGPCQETVFFQSGPNAAPSQKAIDKNPLAQWDTFATIGVNIAEQGVPYDQAFFTPGFPNIAGSMVNISNAVVLILPGSPQARADFAGDGDPQLRVLLAQLAVEPNVNIEGYVMLTWKNVAGQTATASLQGWGPLEPPAWCCMPSGDCVITSAFNCEVTLNGFWLGCEPCDVCEITCTADIAPHPGDGVVDVDDLLAVINAWGECTWWVTCPADVSPPSGNNVIDVDDLIVVINSWGPCT